MSHLLTSKADHQQTRTPNTTDDIHVRPHTA